MEHIFVFIMKSLLVLDILVKTCKNRLFDTTVENFDLKMLYHVKFWECLLKK